jgi:hypothetical protein
MRSDDWLEDLDEPDLDIDELIEQITVDAYGDEGYSAFRQAFDDHIDFPVPGSVVGAEVIVTGIDFDDAHRGLTVTVQRDSHTSTISLLDLDLDDQQVRLTRLTRAYRRWLGLDQ